MTDKRILQFVSQNATLDHSARHIIAGFTDIAGRFVGSLYGTKQSGHIPFDERNREKAPACAHLADFYGAANRIGKGVDQATRNGGLPAALLHALWR